MQQRKTDQEGFETFPFVCVGVLLLFLLVFCLVGLILINSPLFVLFFSSVLSVVCRTQC